MRVGIPYLIWEILRSREQGNKIEFASIDCHDEDNTDDKGDEIWGYCDGGNTTKSKCRGGNDPVGCFTFMFVELTDTGENKYLMCGHCADEIRRIMDTRTETIILLTLLAKKYKLPKDITALLFDLCFDVVYI